jgi:hypothetical protein
VKLPFIGPISVETELNPVIMWKETPPLNDKYRVKGTITYAAGDLNGLKTATIVAHPAFGDETKGNADRINGSFTTNIGKFNKEKNAVCVTVSCWGFLTKENVPVGAGVQVEFGDDAGLWEYGVSVHLELDPDQQPNQ